MKESNKKKAVVVIYAAKKLYDFIWYYSTYGQDYEWLAVCGSFEGENISDLCKKSGIFSKIVIVEDTYKDISFKEKAKMFIELTAYYVVGMRQRKCKKLIQDAIGDYNYDLAVVPTDVGMLCGAFIAQGKEKEVVILEDGIEDYLERKSGHILKHLNNVNEIAGYLLAKMGYANPQMYYKLNTTKYCKKYVNRPERMKYLLYRQVEQLGEMKFTDLNIYNMLIKNTFNIETDSLKADLVLFTTTLNEYVSDDRIIANQVVNYINKNFKGKSILVKRHPRDKKEYLFDSSISVKEIDGKIPAEILLKEIKSEYVFLMGPSNIVIFGGECLKNLKMFYFKIIEEMNSEYNGRFNYKKIYFDALKELELSTDIIVKL